MRIFEPDTIRCAEKIVDSLRARGQWVGVAESCTGGLLAAAITSIPGSSQIFYAGLVTYANEAKSQYLHVDAKNLSRHGAVSDVVAADMAKGFLRLHPHIDYVLCTTGIAGPSGASSEKPIGLVYISLGQKGHAPLVQKHLFSGDRDSIRLQAVNKSLSWLGQKITGD